MLAGKEGFSIASPAGTQAALPPKQGIELPHRPRRRKSTTHRPHRTPTRRKSEGRIGRERAPTAGFLARGHAGAPDQWNQSYRQSHTMIFSTSPILILFLD